MHSVLGLINMDERLSHQQINCGLCEDPFNMRYKFCYDLVGSLAKLMRLKDFFYELDLLSKTGLANCGETNLTYSVVGKRARLIIKISTLLYLSFQSGNICVASRFIN